MLGLGFTHRESVSGGVLGRSCSQHPGGLSSSAPSCPSGSHTAPCFSARRICGGGKAGPQVRVGARSKVVNEPPSPPQPPASPRTSRQAGCSSRSLPGAGSSGQAGAGGAARSGGSPGSSPPRHLQTRPEAQVAVCTRTGQALPQTHAPRNVTDRNSIPSKVYLKTVEKHGLGEASRDGCFARTQRDPGRRGPGRVARGSL